MSKYTKEDIIRIIRENDVKFVRLQFTDIFGTLKNVAITTSQVEKRWIINVCSTGLPLKVLFGLRNPICTFGRI